MGGPRITKQMDAYSEEDILKDDFFAKWLKDNKFDSIDVVNNMKNPSEGNFYVQQRNNYNQLKQDTLNMRAKNKTDQINKEYEQTVKLLTSAPGRNANILT